MNNVAVSETARVSNLRKIWQRIGPYALAVGAVGVAAALRWELEASFGNGLTFITFYPAVAVVGMVAGGRAGILATVLSALAADYWFLPGLGMNSLSRMPALGLFLLSGTLMSVMAAGLARARKREGQALEREKAAEAVRQSESQFRALFEHALEAILLTTVDGRTTAANPAACKMFRMSEAELRQVGRTGILDPKDTRYAAASAERHRTGRYYGELGFVRKGGEPFTAEVTSVVLASEQAFVILRDITERKRAEEALRRRAEEVERLLDVLPAAIWIADDPQCRHMAGNRRVRELYQSAPGENLSATTSPVPRRFFSPEGRELPPGELPMQVAAATNQDVRDVELHMELPSGQRLALLGNAVPLRDGLGQVRGCIGAFVDLTDRKRAEEALRQSEERFRLLADGTPVLIWVHEAGSGLRFVNRAYCEYFGVSLQQVAGGKWQPLVHPEDVPGYVEVFFSCHAQRRAFHAEARVRRHDGQWRWIESFGVPRFSSAGEFLGIAGSSVDITERKAAEAVLARSREELERLVAERTVKLQEMVSELEHFSYTITHDMRAPLRAMRGYGEVANELCARCARQEQRTFLRRIITAADRMDALIRDALNYSRAVRQELPLEPVDAAALLRGMLDSYPELQPSRARIGIEGGLPLVLGNEAGLTQCFSNLLGNAVKFVKPGQTPEVRIWAEQQEGWARIWVQDNGIGIPESMLPRIFDMFSRGHNTYEGTGIGLALVRKVMERMGGKAGVESEEGKGSRFWLQLRLADVRAATTRPIET